MEEWVAAAAAAAALPCAFFIYLTHRLTERICILATASCFS